jgi:hypothetical protein
MMEEKVISRQITVYQCPECGFSASSMEKLEWHRKYHDSFYEIDRLWAREPCWRHVNERKSVQSAANQYYIHIDENEENIEDDILMQLLESSQRINKLLLSGMGQYHQVSLLYSHSLWGISDKRLVCALVYENLPTFPWLDEYYDREAILIDPHLPFEYRSFIQGMALKHEAEVKLDCY